MQEGYFEMGKMISIFNGTYDVKIACYQGKYAKFG